LVGDPLAEHTERLQIGGLLATAEKEQLFGRVQRFERSNTQKGWCDPRHDARGLLPFPKDWDRRERDDRE
jgi:hypothetical protein